MNDRHDRGIPVRMIAAALIAYICLTHLWLGSFLGVLGPAATLAGLSAAALIIAGLCARPWGSAEARVSLRAVAMIAAVVLILLALSGQGRLAYANLDWTVRLAVLGDMGRNPWPFVYRDGPTEWLLRAPLGMYLGPALAWKVGGERLASIALLLQNAALVSALLALCAPLVRSGWRAGAGALAVFVLFSGMDIVGALAAGMWPLDHIEFWIDGLQFSSTVTLLFWVPQHAIAGWLGAAAWLLWRHGAAPARLLLVVVPLVSLWSPLAMIGLLPFAAWAGITLLVRRTVAISDIAVPALATALALPALAYLGADPQGAPFRIIGWPPAAILSFHAFETLPFLAPLWLLARRRRVIDPSLVIVTATLLALPFLQIGQSADLMMRGSIPALAVLAWLVIDAIGEADNPLRPALLAAVAIGAITGGFEIRRALIHPPAPRVDCTLFEAWATGPAIFGTPVYSKGTYLARADRVPALLRGAPAAPAPAYSGRRCWQGQWYDPFPR